MKKTKSYFQFVFLPVAVLLFSAAACENGLFGDNDPDNHSWEIEIDDKQKVIEKTIKGIEFKFCLLNEDSIPSTVFDAKSGANRTPIPDESGQ